MPALIALAVGFAAYCAWRWWQGVPELTDDQVDELVTEYRNSLRLRDDERATEILVDLMREGVTVRHLGAVVMWERD